MVDVDDCILQVTYGPSPLAWSEGWQPFGTVLHSWSLLELLYQWLCHENSTIIIVIIVMVACYSVARARLPLYFAESLFSLFLFFSLATLSQTSENRHPQNFPTRCGLVFNRTFAIPISSKCPLKRTGAEKPKICIIFYAKWQTFSAVIL